MNAMRDPLEEAAALFRSYEQSHRARGPEHLEKAERNAEIAARIEAALAAPAPVAQPVAWRVHPHDYGIGSAGVYAMTTRPEQVTAWERKGWTVEPLYTHAAPAPVAQPIPEGCTPADARVLREANHALAIENHKLRRDADRYRTLRAMHWSDKKLTVVRPDDLKLGTKTFSVEQLDEVVDSYREDVK